MAGYPPSGGYGYPNQPNPYAPAGSYPGEKPAKPDKYGAPANPYGAPANPYGAPSYPGEKPAKPDKYGAPANPYGAPSAPYGAPSAPYGAPAAPYGAPAGPYGAPAAPYGAPAGGYGAPGGEKPGKAEKMQGQQYGGGGGGYGNPFAALVPSAFPPGADPAMISCFQMADQDGSGFIDDKELQRALSAYNQSFSLRTVHLLMYLFTNSNIHKIGPKEFSSVFYSLQSWRGIFERFDRDRSGKIDASELRDALLSMGFSVTPVVLDLLVSKYDKSGGKNRAIEYDHFIECCLTVKGLTEKFKEKDTAFSGSAIFTYEIFMLTVLPFLIA